jgi:hypothetical protein
MIAVNRFTSAAQTSQRFDIPPTSVLDEDALLANRPTQPDPWSERIDELLDIRRMEDDWDGMGAPAPTLPLVDSALLLAQLLRQNKYVPPCRIVAGVTGTVIFEWQSDGIYSELEVTGPRRAEGIRMAPDQKTETFAVEW